MTRKKHIHKAVVLAAGFGSRLDPLTRSVPKPLLPFHGKTMLEHTLDRLAGFGVTDILVNLHTHADLLFKACSQYRRSGVRIQCSYEPQLLGTGGVLRRAAWFIQDQPFWMINADVVADVDPQPLIKAWHQDPPLAVLWMVENQGPQTVQMRGREVVNFSGPDPAGPDHVTFSGVQLIRPDILQYIPQPEEFSTIVGAYQNGMKDGWSIQGIRVPGSRWADVGTPEQYLDALSEWKAGAKWKDVHPTASVHRKAEVHNSVVMAGSRLGSSANIRNAIVGPGVKVNRPVERMVVRLPTLTWNPERDPLEKLGFDEQASVECLSPRGSERSFFRVFQGARSVMLIRYHPEREENRAYAQQASVLRRGGLPVFTVHADDPVHCFSIIEDLGRVSLLDQVKTCSAQKKKTLYAEAMERMDDFHHVATRLAEQNKVTLMPAFTRRVYQYEHNLFLNHYLANQPDSQKHREGVERDLKMLMNRLLRVDRVVIHRDYQSTNLMIKKGGLRLIDFQGMRYGVAMYDLASLLQDPYVERSETEIEGALDAYLSQRNHSTRHAELFWLASVQRLLQAIGAYGRLSRLPGCSHFSLHITTASLRVRSALAHVPVNLNGLRSVFDGQ